jgi:putative FmdB family regulatory protein
MPIYEFKCTECSEFFELLVIGEDDKTEMCCPKCKSEQFERVMSTTNYSMTGGGSGAAKSPTQTRTCSGGSCTTYNIPGPS